MTLLIVVWGGAERPDMRETRARTHEMEGPVAFQRKDPRLNLHKAVFKKKKPSTGPGSRRNTGRGSIPTDTYNGD